LFFLSFLLCLVQLPFKRTQEIQWKTRTFYIQYLSSPLIPFQKGEV
jgi:hypothetical protein